MINGATTLEDLAFIVADVLNKNGIKSVLVGGGAVNIYTENKYLSDDLDFISHSDIKTIEKALSQIGFKKNKGRYFIHPETRFFLEFPTPPVSIGNKPVDEFSMLEKEEKKLQILTPTHCVMDRLAAFYFWNDEQSFIQALMVAKNQKINMKEIEIWSKNEDMLSKFKIFKEKIQQSE